MLMINTWAQVEDVKDPEKKQVESGQGPQHEQEKNLGKKEVSLSPIDYLFWDRYCVRF